MRLRRERPEDLAYTAGWLPWLEPAAAPAALEVLNEVTRTVAHDEGVWLADAASEVAWSDEDFADPFHFSPRGSERLAVFLAERAASDGWFDVAAPSGTR
jgi:hypothetical protein